MTPLWEMKAMLAAAGTGQQVSEALAAGEERFRLWS